MADVFLRQAEAVEFVRGIHDPAERVLAELALNRAIGFLMTDLDYRQRYDRHPFDLLLFVRAAHKLFQRRDVIEGVLNGDIKGMDDLDPFREPR